ncbi:MAG: Coenzyme F420 hydrogenase/dehydrogenase, beta subunit C-terminal domain [Candidatus Thorarchaeota archaeon]
MGIKSFKDLIKEVHNKGICQECGGCVSFCNALESGVIGFKNSNGPPEFINEESCLECGICYAICPQTHFLDDDLNKIYNFTDLSSMPIGYFRNIYICQTNDDEFLKCGIDGGVVNSLLNFLLEKKIIHGAIVAKTKAAFSRETSIAKSREDLIDSSGVKLDLAHQVTEIQKFHTYTSSLKKLKKIKFDKLAIVGTSCQIYTIRCMQSLGIIPSHNIDLCLGLFCYENFFFDRAKGKHFEKHFKVKFEDIEKINIKEDLIIKVKSGGTKSKTIHIPFDKLKNYMRSACNACDDFTNIYADISFGGLGSPDKFTTVITRTKKGDEIFNKALKAGVIKSINIENEYLEEIKDLLSKYSKQKLMRKESFLETK